MSDREVLQKWTIGNQSYFPTRRAVWLWMHTCQKKLCFSSHSQCLKNLTFLHVNHGCTVGVTDWWLSNWRCENRSGRPHPYREPKFGQNLKQNPGKFRHPKLLHPKLEPKLASFMQVNIGNIFTVCFPLSDCRNRDLQHHTHSSLTH